MGTWNEFPTVSWAMMMSLGWSFHLGSASVLLTQQQEFQIALMNMGPFISFFKIYDLRLICQFTFMCHRELGLNPYGNLTKHVTVWQFLYTTQLLTSPFNPPSFPFLKKNQFWQEITSQDQESLCISFRQCTNGNIILPITCFLSPCWQVIHTDCIEFGFSPPWSLTQS